MEERKAKLVYSKTSGLVPRYRTHSALAQVIYNVRLGGDLGVSMGPSAESPLKDSTAGLRLARSRRLLTKAWTSPVVPLGLFFAHLYVIALFLRNPFQKVELD